MDQLCRRQNTGANVNTEVVNGRQGWKIDMEVGIRRNVEGGSKTTETKMETNCRSTRQQAEVYDGEKKRNQTSGGSQEAVEAKEASRSWSGLL